MLAARLVTIAGVTAVAFLLTAPAQALTMKECSVKYNDAKQAGTLGKMTWNDFRAKKCGEGASATGTEQPAKTTKSKKTAAKESQTALTMKECGAKYQKAKEAGSLGGLNWNDYRKANCGAGASEDDTVPAPSEADYTNEPETPTTLAPRGVKFPRAIESKFSSESAGKARMHTCLDAYYTAKDSNSLGGLKWIQKGGGYYSMCNAKLKG